MPPWTDVEPVLAAVRAARAHAAVELRYPDDDDVVAIAALAAEGIHDPDTMPFSEPWTRAESPALERGVVQFLWSRARRAHHRALGVAARGVPERTARRHPGGAGAAVPRDALGDDGLMAQPPRQGQGLGKEMRAAVLHFAFDGLGAVEAHSGSFADNPSSEAVSHASGYEPNGSATFDREGSPVQMRKWILTRDRWLERRRDDIDIEGLDACRDFLAISAESGR